MLAPLASLRLTVVLFALAIVLIFAGTLAQVDKDIWEVMNLYFRAWIAWIPLKVFFPPSFFPPLSFPNLSNTPGGFYFPGGFLIGSAMAVNLLAAHGIRFTVQARGARLAAGLAVLALGAMLTWLVVMGGSDKDIVEGSRGLNTAWLWGAMEAALGMTWLTLLWAIWEIRRERKWERRLLIAAGALTGILLGTVLYEGPAMMPDPSAMRILWQLLTATGAALVLLVGCILLFRKRAGIVLLHAGVGLMMVNELVVYSLHAEGVMQISEGGQVNYAEDIRTVELAITSPAEKPAAATQENDQSEAPPAGATLEDVTVIPRRLLEKSGVIDSSLLPFDVEALHYYPNSELRAVRDGDDNPATAGIGRRAIAIPVRGGSGTDMDQEVDRASCYVKLSAKKSGEPLGIYLLSQSLPPEPVSVGGKEYAVSLRFKRDYKPYTVELIDVRKDDYQGTDTPRNYSSDVRIIDPRNQVDRQVHIWMNNPLRYAGDTFYQSRYVQGPPEGTILQVVKNTGWMIPYVGCMIVATGMLAHFSLTLTRFLRRRDSEELAEESGGETARTPAGAKPRRAAASAVARDPSRWIAVGIPATVVLLLAGWLLGKARVPTAPSDEFRFYEFGQFPLVCEGRTKPFDTLARNSLLVLSGRQNFKDEEGQTQPATRWLLDVITRSKVSLEHRVFRIVNDELLALFHLAPRSGFLYSISEMQPHLKDFDAEVKAARKLKPAELTLYQKKLMDLAKKLNVYGLLVESFAPPEIRRDHILDDLKAAHRDATELVGDKVPLAVPSDSQPGQWENFPLAWIRAYAANAVDQKPNPATIALETMFVSYASGKVEDFNAAADKYAAELAANPPPDCNLRKVDYEAWFNHFEPFFWAWILDLTAFVVTVLAWFGWSRLLNRTAFWVLTLTLAVHTLGLVSRIYISGRPPVTNLYSAAVFIGWAGMIFGLTLEVIYRLGIGNLIASVAGFATLLIAHFLAGDGDTMIVLQAVLDTQFWLATHVVCVTLGYAATFVAGMLGIVFILHGAVTRHGNPEIGRTLTRMTYGTLCFAIFFSFVGTVLGGLWADDSWGRFWGWDPKENGALMIVAWNALVLHARWGGMVRDRGLAMLAVWGNAVVAWSFFGVNELGVGLHSYGFTEGVAMWLGIFVLAQLAILALALVDGWLSRPKLKTAD
ncbi:MAG TPA: cytochrome c biogenesis protein CcsA, partial [Pirellulales bacterium]|nr:cytochrome c biogenesis protein CcsA [Pirellulales bacterium]